jgi:hypothetical protein
MRVLSLVIIMLAISIDPKDFRELTCIIHRGILIAEL